ncbi:hypothetical protein HCH_05815 [Hahella chejuensis KCTC 2396]|uniref:Uncharacterized protein n=1 Tax=Hahella chejuensis (strain KCTC 2396) TaxID=349521 RepID=Q2SA58_HAHCH|nr:hypothetical protein HCH_05815 [Hahella chejuensis KCTC 2396]
MFVQPPKPGSQRPTISTPTLRVGLSRYSPIAGSMPEMRNELLIDGNPAESLGSEEINHEEQELLLLNAIQFFCKNRYWNL